MKKRIELICDDCGKVSLWVDESDKKYICSKCNKELQRKISVKTVTSGGRNSVDEFDIDRVVGKAAQIKNEEMRHREEHKRDLRKKYGNINRWDKRTDDRKDTKVEKGDFGYTKKEE